MFDKFLILTLIVLYAVIMDFVTGKVSNKLIIAGLLISFILFILRADWKLIVDYLLGVTAPIFILIGVFIIKGIGAGDIKLLAVIGGFIGTEGVFRCIIASFIVGAVLSLGKILINKQFYVSARNIIHYIASIYSSRQLEEFHSDKENTIHFTLPILISVLFYIGGII